MFCPKCGKTTGDFYKGFCIGCYAQLHEFVSFPQKVVVKRCHKCGRIFSGGAWAEQTNEELEDRIGEKIKTTLEDAQFELRDGLVTVRGFLDKSHAFPVERQARVEVVFEDKTCSSCSKKTGRYFEVKLQLRHRKEFDVFAYKRLQDFVRKEVAALRRADDRAEAVWNEELREGTDFFFGFKQIGDAVFEKILQHFSVEHEKSGENLGFTKQGKRKIRFTYLVRV